MTASLKIVWESIIDDESGIIEFTLGVISVLLS